MTFCIDGKTIDKITRFDYPKIVTHLQGGLYAETNDLDFLDVVDGREKKRKTTFKDAIYAILTDLEAVDRCYVKDFIAELGKYPDFQKLNLQAFAVNEAIIDFSEFERQLKAQEEAEYKAFCEAIEPILTSNAFDDISDAELAQQMLNIKLNAYLGENWRRNWKQFEQDEIDGAIEIVRNIAETHKVNLIGKLPSLKAQNRLVTLYSAMEIDGEIKVYTMQAKETAKQYHLKWQEASEDCQRAFDYFGVLSKKKQADWICKTAEEALSWFEED